MEVKIKVNPPMIASTHGQAPVNKGNSRAASHTPAATIAALWSNTAWGVGPCMALGNHEKNGVCADLEKIPMRARTSNVFICQAAGVDVNKALILTLPVHA